MGGPATFYGCERAEYDVKIEWCGTGPGGGYGAAVSLVNRGTRVHSWVIHLTLDGVAHEVRASGRPGTMSGGETQSPTPPKSCMITSVEQVS